MTSLSLQHLRKSLTTTTKLRSKSEMPYYTLWDVRAILSGKSLMRTLPKSTRGLSTLWPLPKLIRVCMSYLPKYRTISWKSSQKLLMPNSSLWILRMIPKILILRVISPINAAKIEHFDAIGSKATNQSSINPEQPAKF